MADTTTAPLVSGTGVYTPLNGDLEIRLLELLPPTSAADDDICVELHSAPVDSLPPFEAISYCWGDPTDTRSISCNGEPLDITVSLYGALRRFRPAVGEERRTLWADAICIQQTNLVEKASQVMHMPHVYSRASRVLVWLGEDDDDPKIQKVPASLSEALAFLPNTPLDTEGVHETARSVYAEAQEAQRNGKPNFLDHDWSPIVRLAERPWFFRKWIVQEVCLAQDVVVFCGRVTFPWAHLAEVAYNTMMAGIVQLILGNTSLVQHVGLLDDLERNPDRNPRNTRNPINPRIPRIPDDDGTLVSNTTSVVFQNIQIMRMIRTFRHVGNLVDCIMATPLFVCTDPRDHVYAVLSLPVHQSPHQLRPDYLLTTEQVFNAFAVATLVGEQNLKLLGLCPRLSKPAQLIIKPKPEPEPKLQVEQPVPASLLLGPGPLVPFKENFVEGAGSVIDPTTDSSLFTPADPLDLPSWVPNLTGMGIVNPFTCYSVLPQLFHAGGPTTPPVTVSDDKTLLYLQGRVVDTIESLLPRDVKYTLPSDADIKPYLARFDNNQGLARTQLWQRNWLVACKNFVLGAALDAPPDLPMTPAQWLAFARTMTCEQNNRRDRLPEAVYDAFDEYVVHMVNTFADKGQDGNEDGAADPAIDLMMTQYGVMIESSVLTMSTMRLLGRTTSGRLCQVPVETDVGDSVVVVIGAETPFIMRSVEGEAASTTESRFKLVGESYVSGIMQGETLDDPRYETRPITIV